MLCKLFRFYIIGTVILVLVGCYSNDTEQDRINDLQSQIGTLDQDLETLDNENEDLRIKLEKAQVTNTTLSNKISELEASLLGGRPAAEAEEALTIREESLDKRQEELEQLANVLAQRDTDLRAREEGFIQITIDEGRRDDALANQWLVAFAAAFLLLIILVIGAFFANSWLRYRSERLQYEREQQMRRDQQMVYELRDSNMNRAKLSHNQQPENDESVFRNVK